MDSTFTEQASRPAVELDRLLLAAAAEFGAPDEPLARGRLDDLAADLPSALVASERPEDHAEAILAVLRRHEVRVARSVSPDDALLDSVLDRRVGHSLLVAAVCAEVGRRAGLTVAPVRGAGRALVGIRSGERTAVIDPSGECECAARPLAWMCAHEVAFASLGELSQLLAMHGRIGDAIHAAELRGALPVAAPVRKQIGFEADALRARFN